MKRLATPFNLLLVGLIALPLLPSAAAVPLFDSSESSHGAAAWLARGGGARGGGGGGARGGGGRAPRAHSGFQGSGSSFSRGDRRPQGGFSDGNRTGRVGNPSLDRPSRPVRPSGGTDRVGGARLDGARPRPTRPDALGDRNLSDRNFSERNFSDRNSLGRNYSGRSLSIDRDWKREVNIGGVNLNPGWARPGWGVARPWNWGWYGAGSNPPWGWWGARAAAWGIGTLATAAIINDAVNSAVQANQTYILVPNTSYQLLYGTVQPSGDSSVSFVVSANGSNYQLTADCQQGSINGRDPANAEEAELLNAACQVAFGNAD